MYVACEGIGEGEERGRGRWFIGWAFSRRLGENNTPSVMGKFTQLKTSTFYIRCICNSERRNRIEKGVLQTVKRLTVDKKLCCSRKMIT